MPKPWKKLESEKMSVASIFHLRRDRVVNPRTDGELNAYVLECPDWVNVVALTPGEELIFVRQYRHGIERVTLEIPGGVVDPGEDPGAAAERELLEETGYAPARLLHIGTVEAQPAFQDNHCHTYLALGATKIATPELDEGEDIEVVTLPLANLPEMLRNGEVAHGLVVAAFQWFHLWREGEQG